MSDYNPSGFGVEMLAPLRERVPPRWRGSWLGVDGGWFPILVRLADDLTVIEPCWELYRVHEEDGLLRFDAKQSNADPAVFIRFSARISDGEFESRSICAYCGCDGVLWQTASGGYKTLCAGCAAAIKRDTGIAFQPVPDDLESAPW